MIITIPDYRAASRNSTNKKHWTKYYEQKQEVIALVRYSMKEKPYIISPAIVTIEAYYSGKRHVDTSNLDDKLYVDVLQDIGVLKDDTAFENPRVIKEVYPLSGKDELVISIERV